jgi:hypothetical protein
MLPYINLRELTLWSTLPSSTVQLTQLLLHSFPDTGQSDRCIGRRAEADNVLPSLLSSRRSPKAHPRYKAMAEELLYHCRLPVLFGGPVRSLGRH